MSRGMIAKAIFGLIAIVSLISILFALSNILPDQLPIFGGESSIITMYANQFSGGFLMILFIIGILSILGVVWLMSKS